MKHTTSKKTRTTLLYICAGLLVAAAVVAQAPTVTTYRAFAILQKAYDTIVQRYVFPVEPSTLDRAAVSGLAVALNDPLAGFLPEDSAWYLASNANPYGIDAFIAYKDNAPTVISVGAGGGAYRAGVMPGDQIHYVGTNLLGYVSAVYAQSLIDAPQQTACTLTIYRRHINDRWDQRIERAAQPRSGVYIEYLENENILYIWPHHLSPESLNEIKTKLDNPQYASVDGIALDLRNTIMTDVSYGIELADLFLKFGTITTATSRMPEANERFAAQSNCVAPRAPMVVIVDGSTAMGAEIAAAALKGNNRAKLVGSRTAGICGLTQSFPIDPFEKNKDLLILTIARFKTPGGAVINGAGIEPDIIVTNYEYQSATAGEIRKITKASNVQSWTMRQSGALDLGEAHRLFVEYNEKLGESSAVEWEVFYRALQLLNRQKGFSAPDYQTDLQLTESVEALSRGGIRSPYSR